MADFAQESTNHNDSMILYNVTVSIDNQVKDDWMEWMQSKHIPDIMNTGLFLEYKMSLILGEENSNSTTIAIQYLCKNTADFEMYQQKFAKKLQVEHTERYRGKFGAFRTLLRVISQDKLQRL